MLRRWITIAVAAVAVLLIARGVQKWLDHHSAKQVVVGFVTALKEGNAEAALSLLNPLQRDTFESKLAQMTGDEEFWTADPEFEFRIHHVDVDGDDAVAHVWIDKQGYVLKPMIHLHRNDLNRWKIGQIENLEIDPRWEDRRYERAKQQGRDLAAELEDALGDQSGVDVERVQLDR